MKNPVSIEPIEDLRRQAGIDDVELRKQVRDLSVGDLVRVTFLGGKPGCQGETLVVRVTVIRGRSFRGTLTAGATTASLDGLRAGSRVAFTAGHIHSVRKQKPRALRG